MIANDLSREEVKALVYSYEKPEVTNQLFEFGKMLLEEVEDRSRRINSQSVTVLGWSMAIIAFLVSGINRAPTGISGYFALGSAIAALIAMVFSSNALRTRPNWGLPSDKSWIHGSALVQEDELKRYHIRVIYDVMKGNVPLVNSKSRSIYIAEVSLIVAASALIMGFAYQLLLAKFSSIAIFTSVI